ncbi:uncharacterized protein C8A04DRAFT_28103 [Dichotomopilus funicola]|uniref:LysM domain-containing protein n=1 Tax=Dichotomopilus funicola TaxID=1934379 RepID=A0AAN6ZLZ9_9PEZI|nr:hypothetical protein C8A04DRAFT_28103 [Dichotomopilus funicola]
MQLRILFTIGLAPVMVSARALAHRSVNCIFSTPVSSGETCQSLADGWNITLEQLIGLNPGIACPDLDTSKEYCVMGAFTDDPTTTASTTTKSPITSSTTTPKPSSTTKSPTTKAPTTSTHHSTTTSRAPITTTSHTPTTPTNGVTTPLPTQTGMVGNCKKFHFVQKDETCDTIAALYSITTAQFIKWNPAAKSGCTGLWASTYACVGLIGGTPTTGNGIATPTPTQPGMVKNCNKFVMVKPGDTCDAIAFWNGVAGGQYVKLWNGLSEDCRDIWANAYACIGIIKG